MKTLFLFLFSAVLCSLAAQATRITILATDFKFTPATVTAQVGDTIMWSWGTGDHTTTSTAIPAGAAPWDAPLSSTATTFLYKILAPGTYNYKCTPHASLGMVGTINAVPSTGIAEPGKTGLRVFPNPADQSIQVEMPGTAQNADLQLYDIQGRVMYQGRVEAGKTLRIPTANIPTGMYQVAIMVDGARQSSSVIIRH